MKSIVRVSDPKTGEIAWEEDYSKDEWCFGARNGCTSEMCGGCVGCMELQAYHAGWKIDHFEVEEPPCPERTKN